MVKKSILNILIILGLAALCATAETNNDQAGSNFVNSLKQSYPDLSNKIDEINSRVNAANSLNCPNDAELNAKLNEIFSQDKKDLRNIAKRYYQLLVASPENRKVIKNKIKADFPNFVKFQSALKEKLASLTIAESSGLKESQKVFAKEFQAVAQAVPTLMESAEKLGSIRLQGGGRSQAELNKTLPVLGKLLLSKIDKLDQLIKIYRNNPEFYEMCLTQYYPGLSHKISKIKELVDLNISDSTEFEKRLKEALGDESEIPMFFALKIRQLKVVFKNNPTNAEKELKKVFPYMSAEIIELYQSARIVANARGRDDYEQILRKQFPLCPFLMEQFVHYLSK